MPTFTINNTEKKIIYEKNSYILPMYHYKQLNESIVGTYVVCSTSKQLMGMKKKVRVKE